MNGYKMMADSYRELVKREIVTEEQVRRDIEIYEFLATCNKDDLFKMVDSSAFNDIIIAFLTKVIKGTHLTIGFFRTIAK